MLPIHNIFFAYENYQSVGWVQSHKFFKQTWKQCQVPLSLISRTSGKWEGTLPIPGEADFPSDEVCIVSLLPDCFFSFFLALDSEALLPVL